MANFNTHLAVGATVSLILSESLLAMEILSPNLATIAFFVGTIGSLMPDIDSDYSKSLTIAFTIISILITMLLININSISYSLIELLIMSILVFTTIRFGLIELFRAVSRHRGMFHSIPVAFIFGISTTIIANSMFNLNTLISWIYGSMVTIGYITHLILDELYSVDLGNIRIKKSFGTALKLFKIKTDIDTIQTILIYVILVLLFQISPTTKEFIDTIFSHKIVATFINVILPYDGRWFIHN
jgi:hypothetical protein